MQLVILDDHSIFLAGLKSFLTDRFESVEIHAFENIDVLTKMQPQVLSNFSIFISDLDLPGQDVFPLFKKFTEEKVPILIISMHNKPSVIKKCIDFGISGYILKNDQEHLLQAIERILNGEKFYSPKVLKSIQKANRIKKILSPREEEVIKLIALGASNVEISTQLFVSVETVKSHKKNIRSKLNLKTNQEITEYVKQQLI